MTDDDTGMWHAPGEPPPPSPRTFWSARELLAADFPEPAWAVPGIVAEGVTLLCGAPKVGKSWLSLGLAVAVASGGQALGDIDVEPGGVLYLALEDTPRRLKDRLVKVLRGGDIPDRLSIATDHRTADVDGWLAGKDKRLLVIDVLAKVRKAPNPGTSVYEADYAAINQIKRLADDNGLAAVCVHHTRKMGALDFAEQVSGSTGLTGAADSVIVLKRLRGEADGELHITGRDVDETQLALKFHADMGSWTKLDGDPARYKLRETRAAVLDVLDERGCATPKQIAEALAMKGDTVRQTLSRMVADHQIDTDGKGLYMPVTPVTTVTQDHDDMEWP
jgi:hypothetical protein